MLRIVRRALWAGSLSVVADACACKYYIKVGQRAEALAVLANRREQAADHLRRFGVDDPALA